jgi:hypothetical protein
VNARFDQLGRLAKAHSKKLVSNAHRFLRALLAILLGVNRFEHRGNIFRLASWDKLQYVSIPMNHTPLLLGVGVKVAKLDQAKRFVRDE